MGSQKVQFWQFRAEQHAKTIECCFNSSNQHTSHIRIIKRQNQSVDSAFFCFRPTQSIANGNFSNFAKF